MLPPIIFGAQDLSLKAPLLDTFKPISGVTKNNTQIKALNDALVKALQKTGARAGTFESLTALKREVNSKVLENENLMPIKEAVDKAWNEALDVIVKQQFKLQGLNITLPMQMQYGSALLNNTFDDY